jgi:hypothetical protein
MKVKRTKKLTIKAALKILQLRFGTQVRNIIINKNKYIADSILCDKREFTKEEILKIEDDMFLQFGV